MYTSGVPLPLRLEASLEFLADEWTYYLPADGRSTCYVSLLSWEQPHVKPWSHVRQNSFASFSGRAGSERILFHALLQ